MYDEQGQQYLDCINNVAHGNYNEIISKASLITERFSRHKSVKITMEIFDLQWATVTRPWFKLEWTKWEF